MVSYTTRITHIGFAHSVDGRNIAVDDEATVVTYVSRASKHFCQVTITIESDAADSDEEARENLIKKLALRLAGG